MSDTLLSELPAPVTRPLDRRDPAWGTLPAADHRAARADLDKGPVFLVLRTRTRVDVGGWLGPRRLCAAALERDLLLFAAGPRPVLHRVPLAQLRSSRYNHVTGELILDPAPGLPQRVLRLAPLEAHQLLAQIHHEVKPS